MRIQLADWLLDVDIPNNMAISAQQATDHCMCGYCKNFYLGADHAMPMLRPLLQRLGIELEGPDELCPFEPTIYEATYVIRGSILRKGTRTMNVDGVPMRILLSQELDLDSHPTEPHFALRIGLFELPWLLEEDPNQVISPANCPECLRRMEEKLLAYAQQEALLS